PAAGPRRLAASAMPPRPGVKLGVHRHEIADPGALADFLHHRIVRINQAEQLTLVHLEPGPAEVLAGFLQLTDHRRSLRVIAGPELVLANELTAVRRDPAPQQVERHGVSAALHQLHADTPAAAKQDRPAKC